MSWKKIAGIIGFLIIALLVTVYVVLETFDYNKLKPQVAAMVKRPRGVICTWAAK
ncbi:MAG: hypothetical protein QNI95_16205 [Desulfobacterales bacterium]|nr:hypothetical protein [Desulfobacterales bacterium]